MARRAYKQLLCTPSQHRSPTKYDFDVLGYSKCSGVSYGGRLAQFDTGHVDTATPVTIKSYMPFVKGASSLRGLCQSDFPKYKKCSPSRFGLS